MRVFFYVPHLYYGGVSTVLLNLLKNVPPEVKILVAVGHASQELLNYISAFDGIQVKYLNINRSSRSILKLKDLINEFKAECCVGVQAHGLFAIYAVSFLVNVKFKTIGWEHTSPSKSSQFNSALRRFIINRIGRIAYSSASLVITVSEGVRRDLLSYYQVNGNNVLTLKSPILDDPIHYAYDKIRHTRRTADIRFLYVGRLSSEKCVLNILESLLKIRGKFKWHFDIVGDGSEEKSLRNFVANNFTDNEVAFHGYQRNVHKWYINSDVLLLASKYEGMPTVLVEAAAYGLILVSTDCISGPSEIIVDNVNGRLVPVDKVEEYASALYDVGSNFPSFRNSYHNVSGYNIKAASSVFFQKILFH